MPALAPTACSRGWAAPRSIHLWSRTMPSF